MTRDIVFDFSYFLSVRSPIGRNEIEELMAEPFHTEPDYVWNDQLRDAVSQAVASLTPREQQLIEGKYVWGKSYSELSDMMGWSAKSSAYKAIKRTENKLKLILENDPFIKTLIGER